LIITLGLDDLTTERISDNEFRLLCH
jgi:hypothetical protein